MAVGVHSRVQVAVYARSAVWVANEVCRCLLEIAEGRGLHAGSLHSRLDTVMNGLRVWTATRKLRAAILEVWGPGATRPTERFDLTLGFQASVGGRAERFETHIAKLEQQIAGRPALPAGSYYRLLVELEDGAPTVPGWSTAQLGDVSHLTRSDHGDIIETAAIGVSFATWL